MANFIFQRFSIECTWKEVLMKLGGISNTEGLSYAGRLLKEDIVRLPSPLTNKPDFYIKNTDTIKTKKSHFWRNFFTALTFGLTGLYIAHRNNLFNPARKEAKRIVKSADVINRIKTFVNEAINPETYKTSTRKALETLSRDKSRGESFTTEARRILGDESSMEDLYKVLFINKKNKLVDDNNTERYLNGYAVDVLDKLSVKIEKMLAKMKQDGQNISGQKTAIMNKLFAEDENGSTIVKDTLHEVIATRSAGTIENFVQDSVIASKFAST